MRQTEEFNKVSDKLLNQHKLKPGQVKEFRVVGIKPDPHNTGRFLIPSSSNVPVRDIIYDPYLDDNVEIASIKTVNPDGTVVYDEIVFDASTGGRIFLNGSKPQDRSRYQYLMLSNYNLSNPNRDPSKLAIFEFFEPEEEARKRSVRRKNLKEAFNIIENLNSADLRDYADYLGLGEGLSDTEIKDYLEAQAEKNPESILDNVTRNDDAVRSKVKRAINRGVIKWFKKGKSFHWAKSDQEIFATPKEGSALDHFVAWLLDDPEGKLAMDDIEKALSE